MSTLRTAVADYLALRRSLGYAMREAGSLLPDFVDYLEGNGAEHLTRDLALAWATRPTGVHPITWRHRLGAVRGFAQYLTRIDALTEIPPTDLLQVSYQRVTPYLYSEAEIAGLLAATRSLTPSLRAATYEALIGLLVVSGLRVGEAIGLDRTDVDEAAMVLVVRHGKSGSSREVPLHETTLDALRAYGQVRDRHFPDPRSKNLFVSIRGTRLCQSSVNGTFPGLVRRAGLEGRGERCRPRLHDLRHSFAVTSLLRWHEAGVDVDVRLPLLSSVLGHVNPASTYWYLQAAPELLAITAKRLEQVLGEGTL